MLNSRCS